MKSEIQIKNSAACCHIEIEGTIGVPEEWQFEEPDERVATYEKFREAVRRIGAVEAREVVVDIRSTGGDVNDALLIHDALRQTGAHITTRCYGYTASAATIIAQAASEGCRQLSKNALYLIHAASCATEGNAAELEAKCELLRRTDERLAAIYAARAGRAVGEFEALMAENNGAGRWLSPEEAIAAGLADTLIEAEASEGEEGGGASEGDGAARTIPQQIARGWERLLARVGIRAPRPAAPHTPALPEDRNILHFEEETFRRQAAAEERRRAVHATQILQKEDPSCNEVLRSSNERAYAEDARRLRGC